MLLVLDNGIREVLGAETGGCHDVRLGPKWYGIPDGATSEDG